MCDKFLFKLGTQSILGKPQAGKKLPGLESGNVLTNSFTVCRQVEALFIWALEKVGLVFEKDFAVTFASDDLIIFIAKPVLNPWVSKISKIVDEVNEFQSVDGIHKMLPELHAKLQQVVAEYKEAK